MNEGHGQDLRSLRPGVIPLGPLQMGEIFGGTIATLRRHAVVLFGGALLITVVTELLLRLVTPAPEDLPPIDENASPDEVFSAMSEAFAATAWALPLVIFGQLLVTGIATIVVGKAVIGQSVTLGKAWVELRPRLLPLLGLTVLVGLAVTVGTVLCILPGIWLLVLFSLSTPALILEHATITQSLRRSRDLVRNAWWSIFAILLVTLLFTTGLGLIVSWPFELAGGSLMSIAGAIVAGTVTAPVAAVVVALIYIDRRMRIEGLAAELARAAGMAPPDADPAGPRDDR